MSTAPAGDAGAGVVTGTQVARWAGGVAAITALSRVAGFVRWLVFAATVGAAGVGSVYQSVNTVPNVVYEIAAGGILAAVVVPLVAARVGASDLPEGEDATAVSSALLTRTLVVLVPLTLVLVLAAPAISEALVGDLGSDATGLGTRLLLLFAPQVPLYGLGIVLTGVLQAHHHFLAAALAPLLSSLVVIATYLVYAAVEPASAAPGEVSPTGWLVLGVGTTAGVAAMSLPLLVVARRARLSLRPRWRLDPATRRRARDLAGGGLIALLAQQVAVLVVLAVSNRSGGDGSVVVWAYAQALYLLPYAVLVVPVATAVFPVLSRVAEQPDRARRALAGSLRAVVLLGAVAASGLVVLSEPIGTVFAGLDRGDGAAIGALPLTLAVLAPGLVGLGVIAVATRALYASGSAVAAGVATAGGWVLAAVLPVVLLEAGEGPTDTLVTVAGASTAGMWGAAAVLLVLLRRRWGREPLARMPLTVLLAAGLLAVAAGARAPLQGHWPGEAPGAALVGALVGLVVLAVGGGLALALEPSLRTVLRRRS